MVDVSDGVVASSAGPVAAAFDVLVQRIPVTPAAELGRMGTSDKQQLPVLGALRSAGSLLAERLLGALELTVRTLEFHDVPDFAGLLEPPPSGRFAYATGGRDSQAATAAQVLERLRPGAVELVDTLTTKLATHPEIVPLLSVHAEADEESVAAEHGAKYLALAVATASAVLAGVPNVLDATATKIGVGIGVAVSLLRRTPMPPQYADAVLAKIRAEYRLPRRSAGSATVSGHRFALAEGEIPATVDFSDNGLVTVVDGGVVIRTGMAEGSVHVTLTVLEEAPEQVEPEWDEIVEVSWHAEKGHASLGKQAAPPWPGDYRLRVHATGRDDEDGMEHYNLTVWQAPAAPPIVHKRTDRLGYLLRGEPEPIRPEQPEKAYGWLRSSTLREAATITVVTGASVEDVVTAFGADPTQPESARDIVEEFSAEMSIDPWVAVLAKENAVIAVEYNGYQGSYGPVLRRASENGRAASMFWNVNAVTRLSFAEHGELLASFEPPNVPDDIPAIDDAIAGLNFADYRDKEGKGLVAVRRFTGHGFTAEDLARIEAAGVAFRIVPDLPEHYPYRIYYGMVEVPEAPESQLRDFAWWCAAEATRYAEMADDPDIEASIAARALTPEAHLRARRSQLQGGEHPWLWLALHHATNPDARAAAAETLNAARYAAGTHGGELLLNAQAQL